MPDLYDESISYPELTNGNLDGISGLYNRKGNLDLTFNADIHGIKTNHQSRFGYYKDVKPNENPNEGGVDRELNIVLPYGLKYEISMDIDTPAIV